ncbi:GNAT family N-acetyltransferase [Parabacteroides sp.]
MATYNFEILLKDIPWAEIESCVDANVFKCQCWNNFLIRTLSLKPFVVQISKDSKCIGYFVGYKFKKFGITIIGSPFEGWTTSYQGISAKSDISREERVEIYKELSVYSLKYCQLFQFADWSLDFQDINNVFRFVERIESYWLDISPNIDTLFKCFKQKSCQYSIHKAQKLGVIVRKPQKVNEFAKEYYAQLIDVFAKQGIKPTYGIDRAESILEELDSDKVIALEARHPDTNECMATIIFVLHNKVAFYWGASSYRKYQKYCPNELLMFEAIKLMKDKGVEILEMEGIRPYKEKYNPTRYAKPKIIECKYPILIKAKHIVKYFLCKFNGLVKF